MWSLYSFKFRSNAIESLPSALILALSFANSAFGRSKPIRAYPFIISVNRILSGPLNFSLFFAYSLSARYIRGSNSISTNFFCRDSNIARAASRTFGFGLTSFRRPMRFISSEDCSSQDSRAYIVFSKVRCEAGIARIAAYAFFFRRTASAANRLKSAGVQFAHLKSAVLYRLRFMTWRAYHSILNTMNTSPPVIAFDFDGVIARYAGL